MMGVRLEPLLRHWNTAQKIFRWCIAAMLLSACAGRAPARAPAASQTPFQSPTALAAATQTPPVPTVTQVPLSPTPTATPAGLPTPAPAAPSGWTIYTNPDYVRGLAVQGRTLWAATLGGVVAWDLDTGVPTLYGTRDGLAEIQGNGVAYCGDPENRVYVAHSSAILSVYDLSLKKWSRLPITFEDGTTFKGVQTLDCDSVNHRLLIGSPDGLGILDMQTGRWRRIGPQQGLRVDTVRAIAVAGQAIWVAAGDKGAFLIQGSTVFPFDSASGFPSGRVNDLSISPDSSLWLGYSSGLVRYLDKKWTPYGAQSPAVIPFQTVDFVRVGPDKRIWIASASEGACPFDAVTHFCASVYPGVRGAPITALAVGDDGVAYLATDGGGVLALESDHMRQLSFPQKQLLSDNVQDIAGDASGRLWIATDRGIDIVDPVHPELAWQTITPQRGRMAYPQISGLLPAANGMWLFYAQAPEVSFFSADTWLHLDASKGISDPVLTAALDQRGTVWFATAHEIKAWDGSIMRTYTPPANLTAGSIHALLNQGDSMWVGTDRGLLRYQRFQWTNVLPDIPVNVIMADTNGSLLLGTDQGLIRYDGSQSYFWIINLGDKVISLPNITSIARDGSGRLWVGTAGFGAFDYNGSRWEQFNTASGLPSDYVRKIYTDSLGAIWIAAVTGEGGGAVVRFKP